MSRRWSGYREKRISLAGETSRYDERELFLRLFEGWRVLSGYFNSYCATALFVAQRQKFVPIRRTHCFSAVPKRRRVHVSPGVKVPHHTSHALVGFDCNRKGKAPTSDAMPGITTQPTAPRPTPRHRRRSKPPIANMTHITVSTNRDGDKLAATRAEGDPSLRSER